MGFQRNILYFELIDLVLYENKLAEQYFGDLGLARNVIRINWVMLKTCFRFEFCF